MKTLPSDYQSLVTGLLRLDSDEEELEALLLQYLETQRNDCYTVSNQAQSLIPMLSGAFLGLSHASLLAEQALATRRHRRLEERRGPMAMHLRREAYARSLRDGRQGSSEALGEELAKTEALIRAYSPYQLENEPVEAGYRLCQAVGLLFPYLGVFDHRDNRRIDGRLNLTTCHYPEPGQWFTVTALEGGLADSAVSLTSWQADPTYPKYALTVTVKEPPTEGFLGMRSATLVRFLLTVHQPTGLVMRVAHEQTVVQNALENLAYPGTFKNLDTDRFFALLEYFAKTFFEKEGLGTRVQGYYANPTLVYADYYKPFVHQQDEGTLGALQQHLAEEKALISALYQAPETLPLGEASFSVRGGPLAVEDAKDEPLAITLQTQHHCLRYMEAKLTSASGQDPHATGAVGCLMIDDAIVFKVIRFIPADNGKLSVMGDPQPAVEERWELSLHGRTSASNTWRVLYTNAATTSLLADYLTAARTAYLAIMHRPAVKALLAHDPQLEHLDHPGRQILEEASLAPMPRHGPIATT